MGVIAIKKTKFTESQTVSTLNQAKTGTKVAEVCRKMGIGEATFFKAVGNGNFGGPGLLELRRLKRLEEENSQLKRIVADLTPDKQTLALNDIGYHWLFSLSFVGW